MSGSSPRRAQLVIGPAGSGKTTYCTSMSEHISVSHHRRCSVVNLDPAAERDESNGYHPVVDVRELVCLEDVMEEMGLGPNGALIFAMEYLIDNIDWLEDVMEEVAEDYVFFDCPGQIELYTHVPVMPRLVNILQGWGYYLCAVHIVDCQFVSDPSKFLAGTLTSLSAMLHLSVPHVNILSKCDLMIDKEGLQRFLYPQVEDLVSDLDNQLGGLYKPAVSPSDLSLTSLHITTPIQSNLKHSSFARLNHALGAMIDDFGMVRYCALDITDTDSMDEILLEIDTALQYGDDSEPRMADPAEEVDDRDYGGGGGDGDDG